MTRTLLLLCLLMMLPMPQASGSEYLCRHLSVEDGLSQSHVTALVRDKRGFIWIGSRFGLNRYDFANVTNYYNDRSEETSIPDNYVTGLFVDSRDTLWVAGEKGVAFYCRHTNDFRHVKCDNTILNARSFYDEGNGLLIGSGGKLYFYDYAAGKATLLQTKGGSKSYYTAIHYWKPGFYVLSTRWDGLWLYDRNRATISRLPGCPEKRIMASFVDSDGRMWVSVYGDGVFCYERDGSRTHVLHADADGLGSDIVLDIAEKDGEIWLATDGAGINIYNIDSRRMKQGHGSVLDALGSVTRLFIDRHGDVYAGTVREGAIVIRSVAIRTFHGGKSPDICLSAVSAIIRDHAGKRLWIGDDGQGVLVHAEGTSAFTPVKATTGTKVISIADLDDRSLIVSTFGTGLIRIDKTTSQPMSVPSALLDMYQRIRPSGISMFFSSLSNGKLAILTDRVTIFDPADNSLHEADQVPHGSLIPFYNNMGVLMYFGPSFVGEYDVLTGSIRTLHTQKERITCAAFDGEHTIYIGTETGVTALDVSDGSLSPVTDMNIGYASSLAIEDGHLWIGTNNSLLMKDLNTGGKVRFGRFDGVAANEYIPAATLVTDGYLYMGGVNGLVRVDRHNIASYCNTPDEPVLNVADIEIDGIAAFGCLKGDRINLDSSHRNLRLSVISDGRNIMECPHYRFIVHGKDNVQTIETFSNTINIGDLESGDTYDISVAPIHPDGSYGTPQHLVSLSVMTPWYNNRLSWLALIALVASGLFMAERRRRRNHHTRIDMQLDAIRRSSLEKEVAFLINTNYALRTPLTMIYAPIKLLIERIGNGDNVNIESELQNIYRNTKRMRDVIDMAMELHQVGTLPEETAHVRCDMRRAVGDAIDKHSDEIGNKHIDVTVDALDSLPDIMLSAPDRMRVVLDILMQNAVRRSAEGSAIRISLRMADTETMRISFVDHGPQPDSETMAALFSYSNSIESNTSGLTLGLAYARSIIDTIGGQIGAENNSDSEGGINVWMELPVELASDQTRKSRTPAPTSESISDTQAHLVQVDTSQLTVVVVEEDNDLCMFVSSQLSCHFKRVLHAFNGKDALIMIRQEMPDIVVSSILLPFKSGIELCLDIKSNPDTRHIPVILLTTLKEGPQLESAYGAGADSYLSKPFDMNVLMMRMRNLLHSRAVFKQRYSQPPVETATPAGISNADESFILKIDRIIADNIENPNFNVDAIAHGMYMSRSVLYSKFKAITGTTIAAYINDYRLRRARAMLRDTSLSISEISEKLGFSSQRYFSTFFKDRTGTTPSSYRSENS